MAFRRTFFNLAGNFPEEKQKALWDCVLVNTAAKEGLITLLAKAMLHRTPALYLLEDGGFIRRASKAEEQEIDRNPTGKKGVRISFDNFQKATILLVLASLMQGLLENANTGLNISRSVLLKISNLRQDIAEDDSQKAIQQAKAIVEGLKQGKGAMLDGADIVEVPNFNSDTMEAGLEVLFGLMSTFSGMPRAYVSGVLTAGFNTNSEGDDSAIERGLSYYFNSIFKPVCDNLLGTNLVFKRSSWRKFAEIANLLPVLEGVGEDIVPKEYKDKLIKEVFS